MKTQNAIFGRSRKSFGSATAYTLNGQNIVRTKPVTVANPRTDSQQMQRVRFTAFTAAANSIPEAELNELIAVKRPGQNRRSTLQQQLAPAYGAQPSTDPTSKQKFEPTFDVSKLGDIGTGEVGYVGELVDVTATASGVQLQQSDVTTLINNTIVDDISENVCFVIVSQDGCVIRCIKTEYTFETISGAAEVNINIVGLDSHGEKCYVYAYGEKIQLIGLGTFSVAKRSARKASDTHNIPIGG